MASISIEKNFQQGTSSPKTVKSKIDESIIEHPQVFGPAIFFVDVSIESALQRWENSSMKRRSLPYIFCRVSFMAFRTTSKGKNPLKMKQSLVNPLCNFVERSADHRVVDRLKKRPQSIKTSFQAGTFSCSNAACDTVIQVLSISDESWDNIIA